MKRLFCCLLSLTLLVSSSFAAVKEPNVAGSFYTADPKELSSQIDGFLAQAPDAGVDAVYAMIAPHAGYIYSGQVAAFGYKAASQHPYKTIVVIGPSHHFPFEGISVWAEGEFKTPLGSVVIDDAFAKSLLDPSANFSFTPEVFAKEHSVEVQMPFIQKVWPRAKVVPILMGNPDPKVCRKLAARLDQIIATSDDVLVIASSDMSHYFPYDQANAMDQLTLDAILKGDLQGFWAGCLTRKMEMCGFVPVTTVLLFAQMRGLKPQVLKHANSGDTAGDKSRVVGYTSVIFTAPKSDKLNEEQKKALLKLAQDTLTMYVTSGTVPQTKTNDSRLLQTQGAFVTLRKDGQLRGCIGNIIGDKPLWQTVQQMTVSAASQDPRFEPVTKEELPKIQLEISVLSIPQRVPDASKIELGRDGVIVSDNGIHQGVFLPQVAEETKWSKEEFLNELCSQKAHLPADCWKDPKNTLLTFQADVFEP